MLANPLAFCTCALCPLFLFVSRKCKKKCICRNDSWLPLFISSGLMCMKSSSSVVELVMLLCSQASLASLSFLILVCLPWFIRLTLSAVNPQSRVDGRAMRRLIFAPHYPVYLSSLGLISVWGQRHPRAGIFGCGKYWLRVKGGRPVWVTFDPSTGPGGPGRADEKG